MEELHCVGGIPLLSIVLSLALTTREDIPVLPPFLLPLPLTSDIAVVLHGQQEPRALPQTAQQ